MTQHLIQQSSTEWPTDLAQAAIDAIDNVLIVLDRNGVIHYANETALTVLSASLPSLAGAVFVDLLDQGSRAKGHHLLSTVLAGPETRVFELNHTTAAGQVVMIAYRAVQMPGTGSNPAGGILLIGQPTAPTVATTERLIALNRRLGALFTVAAASSRSLVLQDLLHEALTVTLSELDLCAGAIFLADVPLELEPAQQLPLQPHQLHLAVQHGFTPSFVERLNTPESMSALWNKSIKAELPSVLSGFGEEVGIAAEDVEQAIGPLLNIAAIPLISETRLLGSMYVVSDRYGAFGTDELDVLRTIGNVLGPPVENARLYDALRQTSGRLEAVLDGIDSGVLLTDEQGIVRYANARLGTLLGVAVADWPGRERTVLLHEKLKRFMPSAAVFDGDQWEVAGESRRILRRFAESVADHNGATLGSIEVYSDITQIYAMNRLKDEFVAAAAHDLKTPVTAVKGYAQIALRMARKLDDPKLVQQLTMINARSDDLRLLMDGLLDMSRIQGGRLQLDLQRIVVQQLISSVVQHFDFDLQRKQRSITCELPVESLEVEWDRHRIEGVLINLIGNALKYSPEGGDIGVRVRQVEHPVATGNSAVEIAVTDHGIGIPPAERQRIFERFYRTPEAVEYGFRGTGIGLYITHSIVQIHGGRIWAEDALHGGPGTTMYVLLPSIAPDHTPSQPTSEIS